MPWICSRENKQLAAAAGGTRHRSVPGETSTLLLPLVGHAIDLFQGKQAACCFRLWDTPSCLHTNKESQKLVACSPPTCTAQPWSPAGRAPFSHSLLTRCARRDCFWPGTLVSHTQRSRWAGDEVMAAASEAIDLTRGGVAVRRRSDGGGE